MHALELVTIFSILPIVAFAIGLSGLRIAQEYQRAVVFRLGRCQGTRGPGLYATSSTPTYTT